MWLNPAQPLKNDGLSTTFYEKKKGEYKLAKGQILEYVKKYSVVTKHYLQNF